MVVDNDLYVVVVVVVDLHVVVVVDDSHIVVVVVYLQAEISYERMNHIEKDEFITK